MGRVYFFLILFVNVMIFYLVNNILLNCLYLMQNCF